MSIKLPSRPIDADDLLQHVNCIAYRDSPLYYGRDGTDRYDDLVSRSGGIAQRIESFLSPRIEPLLWQAAQCKARDSAPDDEAEHLDATTRS